MVITFSLGRNISQVTWGGTSISSSQVTGVATVTSSTYSPIVAGAIVEFLRNKQAAGKIQYVENAITAIFRNTAPTSSGYTYKGFKLTVTQGTTTLINGAEYYDSQYVIRNLGSGATWAGNYMVNIELLWNQNIPSGGNTDSSKSYTLTFNGNGGSVLCPGSSPENKGSSYDITLLGGSTHTIVVKGSRSGSVFKGWFDYSTNRLYQYGDPYTMSTLGSMVLYADYGSESGSTTPTTPTTLSTPSWVPPTSTTSTSITLTVGEYFTPRWYQVNNASTYWIQRIVSGVLDNDFFDRAPSVSGNVCSAVPVTMTRPGWMRFFVYAKNGNVQSAPSGPLDVIWEEKTVTPTYSYTVSFNLNGGTGTFTTLYSGNTTATSYQFTLPSTEPIYTGYKFLGWDTNRYATSASYSKGAPISLDSSNPSVTLYAIWQRSEATITFNANGGTCATTTKTYNLGQQYGSLPTATWNNRRFLGWFTQSMNGVQHTTSTICDQSRTLYAHWETIKPATPKWTTVKPMCKRGASIDLRWGSVTSVTGYRVRDAKTGQVIATTDATTRVYTFKAPSNFTGGAQFQVQAYRTDGNAESEWSDILEVGWDKGKAPSAPAGAWINRTNSHGRNIYTNDPTNKTYDISWGISSDIDNDLVGYKIYYRLDDKTNQTVTTNNWDLLTTVDKSATNWTGSSSALAGHTVMDVYVTAYDDAGNESERTYPEPTSVQILTYRPPTAPTQLTIPDVVYANRDFDITWTPGSDPDDDLIGYNLQEMQIMTDDFVPGSTPDEKNYWGNTTPCNADTLKYRARIPKKGIKRLQYRIGSRDALGMTSYDANNLKSNTGWRLSNIATVINNVAPGPPSNIQLPQPIKGAEPFLISWDPSIDPDDNVAGYIVERCLDGGVWEPIGDVTEPFIIDTIPKTSTERHDTVSYRVKGYDTDGAQSGWAFTKEFNVSNNASPVVTSDWDAGAYLGSMENGFSIPINVTDEEGDPVDIEISVIGVGSNWSRVLGTIEGAETKNGGYHTIFPISDEVFSTLPMQMYTLQIIARDAEGQGVLQYQFTRKGTRAFVTLAQPITYPEFIHEVVFTHISGQYPNDCIRKIEVTNNANDSISRVRWEDCTMEALEGTAYKFKNKLAYSPAFNFRFSVQRGPSGASGWISRIAGYFITASDYEQGFVSGVDEFIEAASEGADDE